MTIAVIGAGAVGCYFGGMLARGGLAVTLVGRAPHMDAIRHNGLLFEGMRFQERIAMRTSTGLEAARGADVVLFCVKTLDTEIVARQLAPLVAPHAVVVSLQNGVDNVERMRSAAGIEAIRGVVYVAAEMTTQARVKHSGRGDLIFDAHPGRLADLQAIAAKFEAAGVPCRLSRQIEIEQWTKMVLNCAYNAISALARANYGAIAHHTLVHSVMEQAITEAVAVARAAGVAMNDVDMRAAGSKLGQAMAKATSSTAQDILRGKPTEIDSLNGYITRRGRELGVPTPVNQTLHALLKLLEESTVSARVQGQSG